MLTIELGALCTPLTTQLAGWVSKIQAETFQISAEAITHLVVAGCLSETEADRARDRLMKKIVAAVRAAQSHQ